MEFLGVVLIFQKLALMLILKVSNSRIQSYFHCFVPSDVSSFSRAQSIFSPPQKFKHCTFLSSPVPAPCYLFMHII